MSRLTRDRTAEPVSRDQFSGANADRKIFLFPFQLTTSRIGNLTRLIHTPAIYVTITYIYIVPVLELEYSFYSYCVTYLLHNHRVSRGTNT